MHGKSSWKIFWKAMETNTRRATVLVAFSEVRHIVRCDSTWIHMHSDTNSCQQSWGSFRSMRSMRSRCCQMERVNAPPSQKTPYLCPIHIFKEPFAILVTIISCSDSTRQIWSHNHTQNSIFWKTILRLECVFPRGFQKPPGINCKPCLYQMIQCVRCDCIETKVQWGALHIVPGFTTFKWLYSTRAATSSCSISWPTQATRVWLER